VRQHTLASMTLTTRIFFDVGALLVRDELLGTSLPIRRSELTFTLKFPADDDDFAFSSHPEWRIHAFGSPGGGVGEIVTALYPSTRFGPMQIREEPKGRTIAVLALDVVLPEAQPLEDVEHSNSVPGNLEGYHRAAHEAINLGTLLMQEVIAWLRVATDQFWLPRSEGKPLALRPVILFAEDGDVRHDAIHLCGSGLVLIEAQNALRPEQLDQVVNHLRRDEKAPEPEELIGDAQYISAFGSERDCARATLFAAMACETKIKAALQSNAVASNAPLVDLILKRRTLPVYELFDRPAETVLGSSLRATDEQLYNGVREVFGARNQFVHHLDVPSREDSRAHVSSAKEACRWIDSCVSEFVRR
jgi:hypothetical protein